MKITASCDTSYSPIKVRREALQAPPPPPRREEKDWQRDGPRSPGSRTVPARSGWEWSWA